jgi:hypothetical protein
MVLQADSTTQSALSFNCVTSLAVSSPSSSSDGCLGMGQRRFGKALHIAGDEPVGGKINDTAIGERGALHRGLARIRAEMNVASGSAEVLCDRVQFVRGIGQLWLRRREHGTIDAGALPE